MGVGTTYIDNVYRVAHRTLGVTTDAMGFGSTVVTQVVLVLTVSNGLTGLGIVCTLVITVMVNYNLMIETLFVHIQLIHLMELLVYWQLIVKRQSFLKTQSYST